METKVNLEQPQTISLDQVPQMGPSSDLLMNKNLLELQGKVVPYTSLSVVHLNKDPNDANGDTTEAPDVSSDAKSPHQLTDHRYVGPFNVREFILNLSPKFKNPDAADRIADAMEREEITRETMPLVSVELLQSKLGARNVGEALVVTRAIQDVFRTDFPSPMSRKGLDGEHSKRSLDDLNSVTAPSKRSRLLAASVVNCAQGACASICRGSFRETFPLQDFGTWEVVQGHTQPDGQNTLNLWATKSLIDIQNQLKELASHINKDHVLAWAREYHNNRKSYKKNLDKVKERSKRRYMQKGERLKHMSVSSVEMKDLEKEEIAVAVLHVHDSLAKPILEQTIERNSS